MRLLFFCGGFRNFDKVIDLFDKVSVLDLDTETLKQRLDSRTADDWGGNKKERELILRLHATKEDIPDGMIIDAARPLNEVVDAIVECIEVSSTVTHGPKPKHMSRLMRGRLL